MSHLKELKEILLKTLASSSSASKTVSAAALLMHKLGLLCKGLIDRNDVMNKTFSEVDNFNILQNIHVTLCAVVLFCRSAPSNGSLVLSLLAHLTLVMRVRESETSALAVYTIVIGVKRNLSHSLAFPVNPSCING